MVRRLSLVAGTLLRGGGLPFWPERRQCTFGSLSSQARCFASIIGEHDEEPGPPVTPWVRSVISGVDLMRHPKYNKGLAFSEAERDRLYVRGLLPPAVLSQEVQIERCILNIRSKESELAKYIYLTALQERNERLFYRVVVENFDELLSVISTPTVRLACQRHGLMFRSLPRGLFITLEDRGRIYRILKNWPERNVRLMVVTDGERVGALGDLGVQSVGVPISKLSLYTACGGVQPMWCVPVVLDVGTDNEELLRSPFYVGMRHRRVRGDAYYELLDEFMASTKRRFGNTTVVHFEDLAYETSSKLLNMYRRELPCFNDDVQSLGAAVLAGVLAALPRTKTTLGDMDFILSGEGHQTACIAELLSIAIANATGLSAGDTRRHVWLVDSRGLVTRERGDSSILEEYKLPFCHSAPGGAECADLRSAIRATGASVLVGCSTTAAPPFAFDRQVCEAMSANAACPLIFALSPASPECSPEDALRWTKGKALLATESRCDPVQLPDGRVMYPSQCTTTYIFPGVGLGALVSRCTRLKGEQFIAAAGAVARLVTDEDRSKGAIYPPLSKIREVSANVAKVVAQKAYEGGFAAELPKPPSLNDRAKSVMYMPHYPQYR